jgi:hypothetical protein
MKKTILITVVLVIFAEYSFCQVLYTPGATVGNNTTNQFVGIGTSTPGNLFQINDTKTTTYSPTTAPTMSSQISNVNNSLTNLEYASLGFAVCSQTSGNVAVGFLSLVQPTYGGKNGNFTFSLRNSSGNYNEIMRIQSDGNVGIGTTSPTSLFSVGSSSQFQVNTSGNIVKLNNIATSFPSSQGAASTILKNDGSGNLSWVTLTSLSGITGSCSSGANYLPKMSSTTAITCSQIYDNGTSIGIGTTSPTDKLHVYGAFGIHMATDKNLHINGWDINSNGAMCIMAVNDVNDASIPLNISASSVYFHSIVGIGTVNFNKNGTPYYKLAVCGPIKATEVVVETGWCDFVFDKAYKLKSLTEVEKYISENKHLPDVPSAADVAKNGVSLGQSDSVLLQKVEELTLYIIELNKRIETLEANQKN